MIETYPEGPLGEVAWIDLRDPTPEESRRVREATGLSVPSKEEISEIESSSRLAFEDGAYYLSTPLVAHGPEGDLALTPVGFVLSRRVLVSVRFEDVAAFDGARQTCVKAGVATAEEAFLHILETVVDRAADGLEHAGNECDALSRASFRASLTRGHGSRSALQKVGWIANKTSHIRDELLGVGRIAGYVLESGIAGAPAVNAARMKAVRADIASLTEYENRLSATVQFVLDATLGFINIEQNEIVKTLTIASVVGIPPVLVAGIYGMNFKVMPELEWPLGYPWALGLIVLSAAIPLAWFKKRGWM